MSAAIAEVRTFLRTLCENLPFPAGIPRELYALARRALRGGSPDGVDDLVGDLLADLVARRGQRGSISELLRLDTDCALRAALLRRLAQLKAGHHGRAEWRLVKALRQMVRNTLQGDLREPEALPLRLTVGDRLNTALVAEATAWVLAQEDAPAREPKAIVARLWTIYVADRHNDVRGAAHGEDDGGHEVEVVARVDAARHAEALRDRLGPDLARVVGMRARGRGLAEIAAGRVGVSTAHEKLGRATARIREYVEQYDVERDDLEPVLQALAA